MPPDDLFVNSCEFLSVVAALRPLHPRYRDLALYAANWWDDATFMEKLLSADVPVGSTVPPISHLKVIQ